jgi:hypothetical protein
MRLFVNFFQPSFKLAAKARNGAQVKKLYHPPATPCQRLLAHPRTNEEVRRRLKELHTRLDPRDDLARCDVALVVATKRRHDADARHPDIVF